MPILGKVMSNPNRFFRGWCSNEGNPRSHILHYLICTIRDLSDYEGGTIPEEVKNLEEYFNLDEEAIGDPYYAVYATFRLNIPKGPIKIFEGDDLRTAIFIVEKLSGNKVIENDI
jgi:hypothetical protein